MTFTRTEHDILKLLNHHFFNSAALCLRMTKMPSRRTEHSSCPGIKALHAFCKRFQLRNPFCFKTTIFDGTENQKQYIDDITEIKKAFKGEERGERERERERETLQSGG